MIAKRHFPSTINSALIYVKLIRPQARSLTYARTPGVQNHSLRIKSLEATLRPMMVRIFSRPPTWLFMIRPDKRYTCSHSDCLSSSDADPIYYPTWTSLQAHIRADHPPTCMHVSCNRRTFASQHNLRAHQKLHEQQELEALLAVVDTASTTSSSRTRRRGGELGRDWKCDKCDKEFKSV